MAPQMPSVSCAGREAIIPAQVQGLGRDSQRLTGRILGCFCGVENRSGLQ